MFLPFMSYDSSIIHEREHLTGAFVEKDMQT